MYKIDFSAQYPSAIQTFNLGPDTTTFVEKIPYTGKYSFSYDTKYNWYNIPDKNFNCNIIVKVRNDVEGFLKKEISKLKSSRKQIREEIKTCSKDNYDTLYSQQNAIKVINNSIYGFLGLKSSVYGDMISATVVTAMCRWLTTKVMQVVEEFLVETDTDGLILTQPIDVVELNKTIDKWILNRFNIKDNYLQLEGENFGSAYFYAAKNYIIEHNGKYIIHGSSLKGSRASKVVDRALKLVIEHIFNNKPKEEVINEALDFTDLELEDFEERIKLTMEPGEYDDQYEMKLLIAKQMELKTGQIGTKDTQLNYVVCKNKLPIPSLKPYYKTSQKNYTFIKWVNSKNELDLSYYKEKVIKMLNKFNIQEYIQQNLFGEEYEPPANKKEKPLEKVSHEEL